MENGRVVIDQYSVGSSAKYLCTDGFVLVGDPVRQCQTNGEWTGTAPTCQGKKMQRNM